MAKRTPKKSTTHVPNAINRNDIQFLKCRRVLPPPNEIESKSEATVRAGESVDGRVWENGEIEQVNTKNTIKKNWSKNDIAFKIRIAWSAAPEHQQRHSWSLVFVCFRHQLLYSSFNSILCVCQQLFYFVIPGSFGKSSIPAKYFKFVGQHPTNTRSRSFVRLLAYCVWSSSTNPTLRADNWKSTHTWMETDGNDDDDDADEEVDQL